MANRLSNSSEVLLEEFASDLSYDGPHLADALPNLVNALLAIAREHHDSECREEHHVMNGKNAEAFRELEWRRGLRRAMDIINAARPPQEPR